MKKLTYSFPARCAAILLFVLISCSALFAGAVTLYFSAEGYFDGRASGYADSVFCRKLARNYLDKAAYLYQVQAPDGQEDAYETTAYASALEPGNTNFRYTVCDGQGNVLFENIAEEPVVRVNAEGSYSFLRESFPAVHMGDVDISVTDGTDWGGASAVPFDEAAVTPLPSEEADGADEADATDGADEAATPMPSEEADGADEADQPQYAELVVQAYLAEGLPVNDDFANQKRAFDLLYANKGLLLWALPVSIVLSILLFVFLLCAAGRKRGVEGASLGFFDRIPFDLYAAVVLTAMILCICALAALIETSRPGMMAIGTALLAAVSSYLLLMLCMTFAARVKTKTFWKNNLIWKAAALCLRALKWLWAGFMQFFRELPLNGRALLTVFGIVTAELVLASGFSKNFFCAMLFFGLNICLIIAVSRTVKQAKALLAAGERLSSGKLDEPVDTSGLYFDFKKHGEDLNKVSEGINLAVNERMKSERMKTDLITNVSHDIKTPLTSIISYVDLLKKEDLGGSAAEYVAVLERQAKRLKKLTEDIVTASKASSGAVNAELVRTNLAEILSQSLAEYQQRLEEADITPIVTLPAEPIYALADGRLLWRVFDNLFANVVKYAQPGTRAYIDVKQEGQMAVATVKNVSREPLNIPAEELFERFVRGDASRASEGSGLGLSIAKSLMELMEGSCELSIDGDLFTAVLRLKCADE